MYSLFNSMEQKYVIANIRIPVTIKPDNTFIPLTDYISVEFTEADALPPKKENAQNQDMVMDSLNLFLNSKKPLLEPEPKKENPFYLTLLKDEIKEKTQKPKMNTSFKQRKVFKNRHTKRSLSDM